MRSFLIPAALLFAATLNLPAQQPLTAAIVLPNAITNGVAIAPNGRVFLVLAPQPGQNVPQIAERVQGKLIPFPDATWNSWHPGDDATSKYVHANSIRLGPDGTLWVVDAGTPGFGHNIVPHGPKLIGFDIKTGKLARSIPLDKASKPNTYVDDVRFNGDMAYLTDAGAPGLIVIHMPDASLDRELDSIPATTALKPMRAEGKDLLTPEGKQVFLHADQLELSPDGKTLYFCPASGPLSAIDTQYLDNVTLPAAERNQHVRPFAPTGTTGGTAIDARGNLYVTQPDHDRLLRITPDGHITTLLEDPRLIWVDALWITADGRLWLPAAQLNRTPSLNAGKNTVHYPITVYTTPIGSGPPANDHR